MYRKIATIHLDIVLIEINGSCAEALYIWWIVSNIIGKT